MEFTNDTILQMDYETLVLLCKKAVSTGVRLAQEGLPRTPNVILEEVTSDWLEWGWIKVIPQS